MMTRSPRGVGAFTMLELLVAVSLMVMLLGVLTFVFRQSSEAVSGATETVTVIQKARNFAARLGREVAASVEYYLPPENTGDLPRLAFCVSRDGSTPEDSGVGTHVEFISQTLNDGVLDTWTVLYYYDAEQFVGTEDEIGSVKRCVRDKDQFGKPIDTDKYRIETVISPVRKISFRRAPIPPSSDDVIDKQPSSLECTGTFLDVWGGSKFSMEHQFYFPIYQGH